MFAQSWNSLHQHWILILWLPSVSLLTTPIWVDSTYGMKFGTYIFHSRSGLTRCGHYLEQSSCRSLDVSASTVCCWCAWVSAQQPKGSFLRGSHPRPPFRYHEAAPPSEMVADLAERAPAGCRDGLLRPDYCAWQPDTWRGILQYSASWSSR